MSAWLTALDLKDITLFCQDWGGLIGLRLVARFPERFARVVAANTGLPSGGGKAPLPFKLWVAFSQLVPRFPVGWLISKGTARGLTVAEKAAYDAPFPDERYKAGVRQFPLLVPITDAHASVTECKAAWQVLSQLEKAVHYRIQRRRSDHRRRRADFEGADLGAPKASPIPPSRTPATSCRKISRARLVAIINGDDPAPIDLFSLPALRGGEGW